MPKFIATAEYPLSLPAREDAVVDYIRLRKEYTAARIANGNSRLEGPKAVGIGTYLRIANEPVLETRVTMFSDTYTDFDTELYDFIRSYICVKVVPIKIVNNILEIKPMFQDIRLWIDLATNKFTTEEQYELARTLIRHVDDIQEFKEKSKQLEMM